MENGEKKEAEPRAALPTIVIQRMPDGSVNVNGPIADRVLCYGMLEAAHDAIQEFHIRQSQPIIQTVPAGALLRGS